MLSLRDPKDPLHQLKPYKVGKSLSEIKKTYNLSCVYRMASNEIPAYKNEVAQKAIQEMAHKGLHLYPDPKGSKLVKVLSQHFQLKESHIALGAGSSELIELLVKIFANPLNPKDCVVFSKGSFIAYKVACYASRMPFYEVNFRKDLHVDMEAFSKTVEGKKPAVVFLANPNNPTGLCCSRRDFKVFISLVSQHPNTLFVLDEAYREFVRTEDTQEGLDLLKEYKNLVVLRTFSKAYGLAGLRVGYMLGDEALVKRVHQVRRPFSVNAMAQYVAEKVFQSQEFMKQTCQKVHEGVDFFNKEFDDMGLKYYKTDGNFIFIKSPHSAASLYEKLLAEGLILRSFTDYPQHLRLTVGNEEENQTAVKIIRKALPLCTS